MKRVFTLMLLAFAIAACLFSAPVRKPLPSGRGSVTSKTSNSNAKIARKSTQSVSTTKAKYVRGRNGKLIRVALRTAPPAPTYQLHPDPDRYQQIQQALTDKGYFKGDVNGQWGDDSLDALKRFQADQKLDPDGHLNALTLIGLGLGPKHDGAGAH